jgi:pimeloyl-ACP methyl ester carboxylesterase
MDLSYDDSGEGPPVILLHGLTASRRYVTMGSTALQRGGHRVIAYDARGHGESPPAPLPSEYEYDDLVGDLLGVMDDRGIDSAVLAGASMGAHTALKAALEHPARVTGLVVITPAYHEDGPRDFDRWDALANGLRNGGIEGFVDAYGDPGVPDAWKDTVLRVIRQRLERHEHPDAVADALHVVPRSTPFGTVADLRAITVPTVVVGDRDEADPGHPLAVATAYADAIPNAELVVEEPGASPIAWQGGQVSRVIAALARKTA